MPGAHDTVCVNENEVTGDRGDMSQMLLDDTLPSLLKQTSLPSTSQHSLPLTSHQSLPSNSQQASYHQLAKVLVHEAARKVLPGLHLQACKQEENCESARAPDG